MICPFQVNTMKYRYPYSEEERVVPTVKINKLKPHLK